MDAEELEPPTSPEDEAWESSEAAWSEAVRAHEIWDCAIEVWVANKNAVTEDARDAAHDKWQKAKMVAMDAECTLGQLLHKQECPECGGEKKEEPEVN